MRPAILALLPLLAGLAACDGGLSADELVRQDAARAAEADPAVTAALEDPIMTDLQLTARDDSRRLRQVGGPAQAIYPARDGPRDRAFAALDAISGAPDCENGFVEGDAWAERLPAVFPLYPGARLIEAHGNMRPGCRARVATFRSDVAAATVTAWYHARAQAAGYTGDLRRRGADVVVSGTRDGGGSYTIVASPRVGDDDGGSDVAMIVADGR